MSTIVKAELQIVGKDATGAAFAGVIKHAEELRSALGKLGAMPIGTAQLKEQAAQIKQNTALLRTERLAAQEISRAYSAGNAALVERAGIMQSIRRRMEGFSAGMGMYGWMAGGYMAGRTARAMGHDATAFEHQRAMLATTTGMTPEEVKRAVDAAVNMRVPLMSATENLKAIGELRMVFGSTEEAIHHAAAVQRAAAALKAVNPEGNADEQAYDIARSLELKGVSMDPEHFNRLNNQMVKAINASRGKITAEDYLSFMRIAGTGTTRTLSDDFFTRVAPTLIQEMKGNTAGRALTTLRRQLVGGHMQLQSAGEWMRLGLLQRDHVEFDKIGHIKRIHPGAIVNSDLFERDPYAWVQRYLAPALKKKGVNTDEKIATELATLFSDRYAENMATILLTQKQRIEKDWGLIDQAAGTDVLEKLRASDPKAALADLAAGIDSLLAALGSPLAGGAIAVMNKIADGARWLSEEYRKLPAYAGVPTSVAAVAGLGYVGLRGLSAGFGLLTGSTALKGSAVALTQSAAALDAAAARLGVGGAVGPWGKIPAGAAAGAGVGLGFVAGMSTVLAAGAALNIDVASKYPEYFDTDNPYYVPHDLADHLKPENRGPLKRYTADDLRAALHEGDGPAGVLSGSAEIANKITIETAPDFWTRIETFISNAIKNVTISGDGTTGSTGSTGHAMPEAAPAGWHR